MIELLEYNSRYLIELIVCDESVCVIDVEQLVTGLLQILLPDVKQAKETIAEVT